MVVTAAVLNLSRCCRRAALCSAAADVEPVARSREVQRVPTYKVSFFWEGSLWILAFGVPLRRNPSSGALKSTLPGPRVGPLILNVDPVVVTAAVGSKTLPPIEIQRSRALSQWPQ